MAKKQILILAAVFFLILLTTLGIGKQDSSVENIVSTNSGNDNRFIYESCMDFLPDPNIIFADDDIFEFMKAAHDKIDFYGEFRKGEQQNYDFYKEKFKALVRNEAKFEVKDSEKTYYLNEYNQLSSYKPETYEYLFFDIDADEAPELCINDGNSNYVFIFKYIPDKNQYLLWSDMPTSYYRIIGSQKIMWEVFNATRTVHAFYQLDENGNTEHAVTYMEMRTNDTNIYMVSLPAYEAVSEEMKKQGYYVQEDCYYFRITENQYTEISKNYFEATDLLQVMDNAENVTYTYDELWGS